MITNDAIIYYSLHIISIPFSLFLIIVYTQRRRRSNFCIIVCYAITLILSSMISGIFGLFMVTFDNRLGSCKFQALLYVYVTYSLTIWPACMEFNTWMRFKDMNRRIKGDHNGNDDDCRKGRGQSNSEIDYSDENNYCNGCNNGNSEPIRKVIIVFLYIVAWLLPMLITLTNWFLAKNRGLDLWGYHCMISVNATQS